MIPLRTSPISCSCCTSSFMCSSLVRLLILVRTNSIKLGQGSTGNDAVDFLHTGNVPTTDSKKPFTVGKP